MYAPSVSFASSAIISGSEISASAGSASLTTPTAVPAPNE